MCDNKIKRFELVELTVPAAATGRVGFNTIPQLRNQANQMIVIKDIDCYTKESYANSQVTNSIPGMPDTEIKKCVLVLYVNGEESIKMIPLSKLVHQQDGVNPFQQQLFGFEDLTNVDFDKSYVQFNAASDAATYVIPFGIRYIRLMKNPSDPNGQWVSA
jgi:hypothetical protein